MITPDFIETMALYNKWQNESLIAICDELDEQQLDRDRGMFFSSIFKTLNHIIGVDQAIHSLISTKSLPNYDPASIPYPDYSELRRARFDFDHELVEESRTCYQDWLDEVFEFWSDRLNRFRRVPRAFYYVQLFNHQTHHRSQITSELHKMGIDYGCTDLPYNPYYKF